MEKGSLGWIFFLMLLLVPLPVGAAQDVLIDDFEQGLNPDWEAKSFQGETIYTVVAEDGGSVLCAESRGQASGLVLKKEIDLRETPVLTWRWRVDSILEKGDAHTKAGDDYAARLYVIFPHWAFWKTRTVNYIWGNKLPPGAMVPNAYTRNAMMIAVQSGAQRVGEWITERRNVSEDFRKAFGEEPPEVGAIAVMTDTDNTGASASACYDDIRFASHP